MGKDVKKASVKKVSAKKTTSKAVKKIEADNMIDVNNVGNGDKITPDIFFKIFYEGWRDCFKLKGRCSKLELWCFLLVNTVLSATIQLGSGYFLSPKFLVDANVLGYSIEKIDTYVCIAQIFYWGSMFLPLVPIFSMMVRRMHDLGKLAWYGYLEQIFMGVVVMSILVQAIEELSNAGFVLLALFLSGCFVTFLYSVLYYSFKFLIVTLFYIGDETVNDYGEPRYTGIMYDNFALKMSIFYVLYVLTIVCLYLGVWYL